MFTLKSRRTARRLLAVVAATSMLGLAACSNGADSNSSAAQDSDRVVKVENCGGTVKIKGVPQHVLIMNNPAVNTLYELGVLDNVKERAGVFPHEYYDDKVWAKLQKIKVLSDKIDGGGHLKLSREVVVSAAPDLVIGTTDNVNRKTLEPHNIPLVQEETLCGGLDGDSKWADIDDHIDLYAKIFNKEAEGKKLKAKVDKRVQDVIKEVSGGKEDRSVAVLWPTVGGGTTYAYGRGSMSNPIVTSAGLKNVFGDQEKRVFEVNAEQIVARQPDVIIALHSEGTPEEVKQAVRDLVGSKSLPAVENDMILPMFLNFAEAPSLLSVKGLETLNQFLKDHPKK